MKRRSISWSIALKFSVFLAVFVLLLSLSLIFIVTKQVRNREERILSNSISTLKNMIENGRQEDLLKNEITKIPYFISWTIAEYDTLEIIYSNDPFIPVMDDTGGKAVHYTQKDYYTDGDLNIMYVSSVSSDQKYLFQASMNMDQDSIEKFLSYLPVSLLIIFLPLLILSFFAAYLISKNTMKPISKITSAARGISSSNLESSLPVTKKDNELNLLAKTFNDLFDRLKADFEKERAFTSNVSHELKTPVAVIQGHANLLQRWGKDDPSQLEKSLAAISKETKTMSSIITNLLQLTHLENKDVKLSPSSFTISSLITRITEDVASYSPATTIITDLTSKNDITITTDLELLHQVCTVITQNSVKFCTEHPCTIKIHVESNSQNATITFTDNGPGINPQVLPHIFHRFYRGDESHNRKAGGSGLGLSIAKEIMNVLGGSISAKSTDDGQTGAIFSLSIPVNHDIINL